MLRSTISIFGLVVGVIFAVAGALHASVPWQFLESVRNYRIVPTEVAVLIATILPLVQLLLGSLVIFGIRKKLALLSISFLLLTFAAAEGSAIARGLDISCGCFGAYSPQVSIKSLISTIILALFTILAAYYGAEDQ